MTVDRLCYVGILTVIVHNLFNWTQNGSWLLVAGCVVIGALTTTLAEKTILCK